MYIVKVIDRDFFLSGSPQNPWTENPIDAAVYPLYDQALDAFRTYQEDLKPLYELTIEPWQK